ncbi:MAG: hypothetical protein AB7F96_15020 [Beijerinckiaceae bacterium]
MDMAAMQRDAWTTIALRQPHLYRQMQAAMKSGIWTVSPETTRMVAEKVQAGQEISATMMRAMMRPPSKTAAGAAAQAMRNANAALAPIKRRTSANAKRLARKRRK